MGLFSYSPIFAFNNKFSGCRYRAQMISSSARIETGITWNRTESKWFRIFFLMFVSHRKLKRNFIIFIMFGIYSERFLGLLDDKRHFEIRWNVCSCHYELAYHYDTIQRTDVDRIVRCIRNVLFVHSPQLYLSAAKIKWKCVCMCVWIKKGSEISVFKWQQMRWWRSLTKITEIN